MNFVRENVWKLYSGKLAAIEVCLPQAESWKLKFQICFGCVDDESINNICSTGFFAEWEFGREQESWLVRNCSKPLVEVRGNQNLELVTQELFV